MQKSMWDEATPINRTAARIGGKQNKIKRTKTNRKTSGHSSVFPGPKQSGIAHPAFAQEGRVCFPQAQHTVGTKAPKHMQVQGLKHVQKLQGLGKKK